MALSNSNTSETLTEEQIIAMVGAASAKQAPGLSMGIGDDAAVLEPGLGKACVTTDLLVEKVHFDLAYITPHDLGLRAMAANLSDLGAMGAKPAFAFLSLGLPKSPARKFVQELLQGLNRLGQDHGLILAGGDTVRSPMVTLNICLIGYCKGYEPILRATAQKGDAICVSGNLGASRAGLFWLQNGGSPHDSTAQKAIAAHLRPLPRVNLGLTLAQNGLVNSMMDISDGLATDLARLCRASGVGASVWSDHIPMAQITRGLAAQAAQDPLDWALTGGEDFELLFTCPPGNLVEIKEKAQKAEPGLAITQVGEITQENGVFLELPQGETREISLTGFDHFKQEPA
ncbi:thiamine-phosphate kinase [Dethiosulfatarculus sandiegensis]|uniref:Thiamine-monophosphate kinase n=1 Tax=Dethiosulfatarculus sandiegensis TaxID=1429043 RepID=A0A0D2JCI7_9BACT|nr:thiamine-phosphate kinase [Dethiosulfatarculus sandiegensis]KIX15854.1 thiamine-monophosphate kinase [Dethiosulfatarculus sandiegensis]